MKLRDAEPGEQEKTKVAQLQHPEISGSGEEGGVEQRDASNRVGKLKRKLCRLQPEQGEHS